MYYSNCPTLPSPLTHTVPYGFDLIKKVLLHLHCSYKKVVCFKMFSKTFKSATPGCDKSTTSLYPL